MLSDALETINSKKIKGNAKYSMITMIWLQYVDKGKLSVRAIVAKCQIKKFPATCISWWEQVTFQLILLWWSLCTRATR